MNIAIKLETTNILGAFNACVGLAAQLKAAAQLPQYPAEQHHEAFTVAFRALVRARAMLPEVEACLAQLRNVDTEAFNGFLLTINAIGGGVPSNASPIDLVAGLVRFVAGAQREVEQARELVLGSAEDAPPFTCDLSSLADRHSLLN